MIDKLTLAFDTDMILLPSSFSILTDMSRIAFRTLHRDLVLIHPFIMQRPDVNPTNSSMAKDGSQSFEVDCGGRIVSVTVKQKQWKKIPEAQANFPMWVGAIAGTMGESTPTGFVLDNASIQIFEKKPKGEAAAPTAPVEAVEAVKATPIPKKPPTLMPKAPQ